MREYDYKRFDGIEELWNEVLRMPKGIKRKIYRKEISSKDNEFSSKKKIEDHYALVNEKTEELASIVSEKYSLLQHRESFYPIKDAIQKLGLNVSGKITEVDGGNKVVIKAMTDRKFYVDQDSEYRIGFRFENSFDSSRSAVLSAHPMRLTCMNQMTFSNLLIREIKRKHIGDMEMNKRYKEWFSKLFDNVPKLKKTLIEARSQMIKRVDLEKLFESWDIPEKRQRDILSRIKFSKELSKKELYDAMTSHITEKVVEKLSTSAEREYQKKAERVLEMSPEQIIPE